MSGPHPKRRTNSGVADTGLEGVLAGFGVQLGQAYIYTEPRERVPYNVTLTALNAALVAGPQPDGLGVPARCSSCRTVGTVNPAGGPGGRSRRSRCS